MNVDAVITSSGEGSKQRIRAINADPAAGLVLLNAMPHVQIIGTQYAKLIDELADEVSLPVLSVASRALEGDWLDGFEATLFVLADKLPLVGSAGGTSKVAIVGHLLERNEEEGLANVTELEGMVRALGLEPVSTWLSGRPTTHLPRAGEADFIVGLPHARGAAARLAERAGAILIQAPLPFGLAGTRPFTTTIAETVGRTELASKCDEDGLARVIPRFERAVAHHLMGKRVAFLGDPHLFDGIVDITSEPGWSSLSSSATRDRRAPHRRSENPSTLRPIRRARASWMFRSIS